MYDAEWKNTLRAGKPIRVKVTTDELAPMLRPGDYVTVKKTELSSLRAGDIVLCCVGLQTSLKRVRRLIRSSGVEVAEVASAHESVMCVGDGAVMGKVMSTTRQENRPQPGLLDQVKAMLRQLSPSREASRR